MSNPNPTLGPPTTLGTLAITGATGTIGRDVLTSLIAGGHGQRVRAVVRDPVGITADVQTVHADFSDPDTLATAFDGAEAVLLLCGHHPDQLTYERAALAAATAAGVQRVVYISAAAADRDPAPALALGHQRLERELLASTQLAGTVLRPTAVFSSLLTGIGGLIRPDGQVPLAFGAARVTLVDARDVGDAAAVVLADARHAGCVYTLTGPQSLSGDEIVAALADALEVPLQHIDHTPAALQDLLLRAGAPTEMVGHLFDLFSYFGSGEMDTVTTDVATLTGHQPRSLDSWLRSSQGEALIARMAAQSNRLAADTS
ncbi:NAD(P)H-binding protein [Mycolicibacterium hodleri]|uniref:NAD-dependent epimerase/dehydratase family protein n=1 Tax=Mycolicibacterium hodleri TaxID=49897 RepID=A0A502EBR6_9MYCO|nr:NAD(P)H-binding protein [Mycolicibacterium hodleri]TPG34449.1 NAD-dependent epimerase/dehydratase family protein [Mycolicibacterium hodleri]